MNWNERCVNKPNRDSYSRISAYYWALNVNFSTKKKCPKYHTPSCIVMMFSRCIHSLDPSIGMAPDFFSLLPMYICLLILQIHCEWKRILMDNHLFDSLSNWCPTFVDTKSQMISAYCTPLMCSRFAAQKPLRRWPPVTTQTWIHTMAHSSHHSHIGRFSFISIVCLCANV